MNQELNKRRQELEDEIDGELGLEKGFFRGLSPASNTTGKINRKSATTARSQNIEEINVGIG